MLPRSLEAVCRDLENPNPRVRLSAIQESARHADGEGRGRIVSLLIGSLAGGEARLRHAAAVALADAGATEAIPNLTPLLCDGDPETRRFALLALGELAAAGDADLLSRISPFLSASDPRIRYQAVVATHAIAGGASLGALSGATTDSDPLIRELSARLMGEVMVFDPSASEKALALLDGLARDAELFVRAVAQLSSHEHGNGGPSDGLTALIDGTLRAREPEDEQRAIELVGRLRLPGHEKILERRAFGILGLSHDPFRYHARAALSAMGHEAGRRSVERGLRRGSKVERAALIFALGQVRATEFAPAISRQAADPALRAGAEQALLALGLKGP